MEGLLYIIIIVGIIYAIKSPRWKANRRISPNGLNYGQINYDRTVNQMSDRDIALKELRGEYDR